MKIALTFNVGVIFYLKIVDFYTIIVYNRLTLKEGSIKYEISGVYNKGILHRLAHKRD